MSDDLDDRDPVSPGYSVALVARYYGGALPRVVAPVDADDCAPGLETGPGCPAWPAMFEFVCDRSGKAGAMSLSAGRAAPGDDITRAAFGVMDRQS